MIPTNAPEELVVSCLELADEARRELNGPGRAAWLDRLESELPDLRTALRWLAAHGEADGGLRLLIDLRDFWRWHLREGRVWFAEFLALPEASARTVFRARALDNAATLAFYALFQRDDPLGDDSRDDLVAFRSMSAESLEIARELGAEWDVANVLGHLATEARLLEGDSLRARALFEESLAIWQKLNDQPAIAYALAMLACAAIDQGDFRAARSLVEESLAASRELRDSWATSLLDTAAGYAASHGAPERALRLGAATAAQRAALRVPPFLQAMLERRLESARMSLDPASQAAAWEEGRAMTLEESIAYALEEPAAVVRGAG
jgi:non-specific serine/threonine protein kinase